MDAIIKQTWLEAISFLSENMQNRIIGIVTRYQLLGTLPEKMSRTVVIAVRMILADLGVDVSKILPSTGAAKNKETETTGEEPELTTDNRTQPTQQPLKQTVSETINDTISSLPRKEKKALKKKLRMAV